MATPVKRSSPPLGKFKWKSEEESYLAEQWGKTSIATIAKNLNRTVNAVKIRAHRIGLGAFTMAGDYITLNQLLFAVKGTNAGGNYVMQSWVKNRGLPVHIRKVNQSNVRVVYLNEFWEWAYKNRSFLDFSKMEPLILGSEPEWVTEQRRKDFQTNSLQRKDRWTPEEDGRLKMLLKQHKYGYAEMSKMLNRSEGAIVRRCIDLGLKERPLREGTQAEWTEGHFKVLEEGIRNGDSYAKIGAAIGKSEKAVRGKVYFVYLTENQDKVRAMMGAASWGCGAPVPTVKQAIVLSRTRTAAKNDLERLCGVLLYRTRELIQERGDYDQYWQRSMCARWDELKGVCGAGCEECDSCTEFQRIRPQYCVRCGSTFFERIENRRCARCRAARRSSALRKYAALGKRYGR